MIRITTSRLNLREMRSEDVTQDYISWLNDPLINKALETRFAVQNKDSIQAFVTTQLANPDVFLLRIALSGCDTHIGNIKLGPINRNHASAQISLLIGTQEYQGQGFATEAIATVSAWAFGTLGLTRIEGGCYSDNFGSLRAFLKCGYIVEGYRRDAVVGTDGTRQGCFLFARLTSDPPGGA
jgi:[ribosomal protein S5]-alanine N-acetyltransferase